MRAKSPPYLKAAASQIARCGTRPPPPQNHRSSSTSCRPWKYRRAQNCRGTVISGGRTTTFPARTGEQRGPTKAGVSRGGGTEERQKTGARRTTNRVRCCFCAPAHARVYIGGRRCAKPVRCRLERKSEQQSADVRLLYVCVRVNIWIKTNKQPKPNTRSARRKKKKRLHNAANGTRRNRDDFLSVALGDLHSDPLV